MLEGTLSLSRRGKSPLALPWDPESGVWWGHRERKCWRAEGSPWVSFLQTFPSSVFLGSHCSSPPLYNWVWSQAVTEPWIFQWSPQGQGCLSASHSSQGSQLGQPGAMTTLGPVNWPQEELYLRKHSSSFHLWGGRVKRNCISADRSLDIPSL